MAVIHGKNRTRHDLIRRVGNQAQLGGIRRSILQDGRADGVRMATVDAGALKFDVLESRCLDVFSASYKGIPFGYLSKSGIRHPAYFFKNDVDGFLDNFGGGVVCTCGLSNIGSPRETNGKRYETHGELANVPADTVSVTEEWNGDALDLSVSGAMRHSRFYAEDLILRRKITTSLGANRFLIHDAIINMDASPAPCMILYHINLGFPFLDEKSILITSPILSSRPRPGTTEEESRKFGSFARPEDGVLEACIYHTFKPDSEGRATVCLFNPELGGQGMGVYVRYRVEELPVFVQWKMLRSREYVCGFAPATHVLENKDELVVTSALLKPFAQRECTVEVGVLEGRDICEKFCHEG